MKILLIAVDEIPLLGYSFRTALERLGHQVEVLDERQVYHPWLDRGLLLSVTWRVLRKRPAGSWRFNRLVLERATAYRPDMIIFIKGAFMSPETLAELKRRTGARLVNYSSDDPFNPLVSNPWIPPGLPFWDLYATPRRATIPELQKHCKGKVIYVPFGYDPAIHFPEPDLSKEDLQKYGSDVVFVGTCDSNRIPMLEQLASDADMNLALYGTGYYRNSEILKRKFRGVAHGRSYRCALGASKIALALVRHTNRDRQTLRTFEIPACGAFMLAERTEEHEALFDEGREAAFFSTNEEMFDKIKYYLARPDERERVARAGHARVIRDRHTYQDRLQDLLSHA